MNEQVFHIDAYTPAEMAHRVETVGISKGNLNPATMFALAVLAGAFIALGGNVSTIALTDNGLGYGVSRLLGGLAFFLGLILVIVGGAELFTGNNLITRAWASKRLSTSRLLRNWAMVYIGNFVGALGTAVGVYVSRQWTFDAYRMGATALTIANAKVNYDFLSALALGVFCNALVCRPVWLCFSARTTTDKIVAIVPPITAFVAAGFEHSIANMYFIPLGLWLREHPHIVEVSGQQLEQLANLPWRSCFVQNLFPVTLGNLVGGTITVAGIHGFVYLQHPPKNHANPHE